MINLNYTWLLPIHCILRLQNTKYPNQLTQLSTQQGECKFHQKHGHHFFNKKGFTLIGNMQAAPRFNITVFMCSQD